MNPPPDAPDTAPHTAALAQDLRTVLRQLRRRLREQASIGDFTPSQFSVLQRLENEGPATAAGLARAEGMRPQSIAPILATLAQAGLVEGAPDPADGRQTLFSITDHCRRQLEEKRAARQDWLIRALGQRFSAREQDTLSEAVALLKRLAGE
jgi:DNA-binding MarR family transcriptional regulator